MSNQNLEVLEAAKAYNGVCEKIKSAEMEIERLDDLVHIQLPKLRKEATEAREALIVAAESTDFEPKLPPVEVSLDDEPVETPVFEENTLSDFVEALPDQSTQNVEPIDSAAMNDVVETLDHAAACLAEMTAKDEPAYKDDLPNFEQEEDPLNPGGPLQEEAIPQELSVQIDLGDAPANDETLDKSNGSADHF
jgi:hypothetical protein